ncbi:MAG: DUF3307 domain-containing protein, partial [Endomicrobia bacterium]|nr:DUF3307 domain-containing protein [Endomicrobiia bacterium]
MKIFFRLLLAHLISDFTLQTNFVARWKKQSFIGVVAHSLTFFVIALILTWRDLNKIWFDYPIKLNGLWCLIIISILHIIEDEYRSYNVRHFHIQDNILFFIWDQIIHIVFLFVFSPSREILFAEIEPWVIILCFFVLTTHALSVFVLYVDTLVYNKSTASDFFHKKYYPIAFNIIVFLCFLLPGKFYLLSVLFIPLEWIANKIIKYSSTTGWWFHTLTPYLFGIVSLNILR